MDFRLTEDQELLAQGVRDFLSGSHGPERLRALDSGSARDTALWDEIVAMGLPGLLVPEEQGGLGLGLVEGVLIAQELGRAGVAEPVVDTALIAVPWLLARGSTECLPRIAAGTTRVALAHPANPWIADLDQADHVIRSGKLDAHRRGGEVALDSIDPLRRVFAPGEPASQDDRLLDIAALMTAAQLVGLADAMVSLAVEYAKDRQQFGQPIGGFQAVKHQLASATVRDEFAKPVVLRAAASLEREDATASVHVSHAKLAAGDAAMFAAEAAIQVHGAMGYTYEVDLHFWMKRSWALAGAWGDRAFHLRRVDDAVTGGSLPIGPSNTFA